MFITLRILPFLEGVVLQQVEGHRLDTIAKVDGIAPIGGPQSLARGLRESHSANACPAGF